MLYMTVNYFHILLLYTCACVYIMLYIITGTVISRFYCTVSEVLLLSVSVKFSLWPL